MIIERRPDTRLRTDNGQPTKPTTNNQQPTTNNQQPSIAGFDLPFPKHLRADVFKHVVEHRIVESPTLRLKSFEFRTNSKSGLSGRQPPPYFAPSEGLVNSKLKINNNNNNGTHTDTRNICTLNDVRMYRESETGYGNLYRETSVCIDEHIHDYDDDDKGTREYHDCVTHTLWSIEISTSISINKNKIAAYGAAEAARRFH
ncbi:hypothetical protein V9T40_014854 [Parthenolecanium corni]|uniref:Uncharacterized protein n=1 Tax=Parthenolecanium corni TaxID=536013 RepID=A0AAN9XX52_9HEMI